MRLKYLKGIFGRLGLCHIKGFGVESVALDIDHAGVKNPSAGVVDMAMYSHGHLRGESTLESVGLALCVTLCKTGLIDPD